MNVPEMKIKIFRQVDSLENAKLSIEEKQGIENAIGEIDLGKGIQHEKVMRKYRKKYLNA